jgi:hypothetical protein
MTKPKKSAQELLEMIASEVSLDGVTLNIHKDPMGWHATAYGSSPNRVIQVQGAVGNIVERLRSMYDLEDSTHESRP